MKNGFGFRSGFGIFLLIYPLFLNASTPSGHSEQASAESEIASAAASSAVVHSAASVIVPSYELLAVPLWLAGSTSVASGVSVAQSGIASVYLAEDIWDAVENSEKPRPELDNTIGLEVEETESSLETADPDPGTMMREERDNTSGGLDPADAMRIKSNN